MMSSGQVGRFRWPLGWPTLWTLLSRHVQILERRGRRDRRSYPWSCTRGCGPDSMRVIGAVGWPQIVKCNACGNMDRRLPKPRRAEPWEPLAPMVGGFAWPRFVVAGVCAGLLIVALLGGLP